MTFAASSCRCTPSSSVGPRVLELLHTFDLEQLDDIVVVDIDRGQSIEDLLGLGVGAA